jgi:hypothetical protein
MLAALIRSRRLWWTGLACLYRTSSMMVLHCPPQGRQGSHHFARHRIASGTGQNRHPLRRFAVALPGDPVTRPAQAHPPTSCRLTTDFRRIIMTYFTKCTLPSRNYFEALETAEQRALHSFFDQHVIEDDEIGYRAVDEGDYNALPTHLAIRVVHTVHGGMLDEF